MKISYIFLISFLLLAGCSPTFLISRGCKSYFFGSGGDSLYKMVCSSGDLKKILEDTNLPVEARQNLYKAQCVERSKEMTEKTYALLTSEQKKELKFNFKKYGYDINYKPTGNYRLSDGYDSDNSPEFCMPYESY